MFLKFIDSKIVTSILDFITNTFPLLIAFICFREFSNAKIEGDYLMQTAYIVATLYFIGRYTYVNKK